MAHRLASMLSAADNLRPAPIVVRLARIGIGRSPVRCVNSGVIAMHGLMLVVTAGSSSIKFSGYSALDESEPALLFDGQIEAIGVGPHMTAKDAAGGVIAEIRWPIDAKPDHEALFDYLIGWIRAHLGGEVIAVGHRVVHGGTAFAVATRVDAAVLSVWQALCPPGAAASAA